MNKKSLALLIVSLFALVALIFFFSGRLFPSGRNYDEGGASSAKTETPEAKTLLESVSTPATIGGAEFAAGTWLTNPSGYSSSQFSAPAEQIALEASSMESFFDAEPNLKEFYDAARDSSDNDKALSAFRWLIMMCDDVVSLSHSDMSTFIGIQSDQRRMDFYLGMYSYCLSGANTWEQAKAFFGAEAELVVANESLNAYQHWHQYGESYGKQAMVDEAAIRLQNASSLLDMVSAFGGLETAGYLFSGEVEIELPVRETKVGNVGIAWLVPMLYFCNLDGGCDLTHPFTMYHCTWNHCDANVTGFSSAVYRTVPPYQQDAIASLYAFLLRVRENGTDAVEVDPQIPSAYG
jgi:hypothetical protein